MRVFSKTNKLFTINDKTYEKHTAQNIRNTIFLKYSIIPIFIIRLRTNSLMTCAIHNINTEMINAHFGEAPHLNAI